VSEVMYSARPGTFLSKDALVPRHSPRVPSVRTMFCAVRIVEIVEFLVCNEFFSTITRLGFGGTTCTVPRRDRAFCLLNACLQQIDCDELIPFQ
jgi:hypothetical protein